MELEYKIAVVFDEDLKGAQEVTDLFSQGWLIVRADATARAVVYILSRSKSVRSNLNDIV